MIGGYGFAHGEPGAKKALAGVAEHGDQVATESLFGVLYVEMRRIAKRELGKRAGFVSISATTLLHEVYLDMSVREG